MGASAVGLIDVGRPAGLNLNVDRVGIAYDNGQSLGDPASPVQLSASIVGGRPVPSRAVPEVVARVVVDRDPVDVTDKEDARWLRACLPPSPEQVAALEAEIALAAPLRCCWRASPSRRCLPRSRTCLRMPCRSSPRRGRCRASRSRAACASCTASTKPPDGRWRGCRWRAWASRRRCRRWVTAARPATASSVWRSSTIRRCASRPSAAAGRGAGCWRGWPRSRFRRAASCGRPRPRRRPP